MFDAVDVLDYRTIARGISSDIARADRHLAVTAGHVEHIDRLAKAGDATAQPPHQRLPSASLGRNEAVPGAGSGWWR